MTVQNPIGTGMSLGDFLEILREAVNRSYDLTSDGSIHVNQHSSGRLISAVQTPVVFFAAIIGWTDFGDSKKRWKYMWKEVDIDGAEDDAKIVENGRKGGDVEGGDEPHSYIINLAEINNRSSSRVIQGNGMELVAPIGGGSAGLDNVSHKTIVPVWTGRRGNGTTLYWTNVANSDHVKYTTDNLGPASTSADESHSTSSDPTEINLPELNDNKSYDAGKGISWNMGQRVNYNHTDSSPVLREFYRRLKIRPNGKIEEIFSESRCTVDSPEVCDNGGE